jgi:hypothetical protein
MATGRIGTTPVLQVRWSKAPSAGTTSLSGLDDNSVSLVYSVGYEAVYRNGVLLSRTNDYTATDGTTVTLIDATIAGDIIEIFANQTIPLSDTYSQTVANGKFINNTLTTTTGDIIYASAANTPARLGIGSTDQVLKVSGGIPAWGAAPAASFVGCAVYATAATISISNTTETKVAFDAEFYDTDGFHSNVTNNTRLTVPSGKAGKYQVWGWGEFAGNTTGYRQVQIWRNNNTGTPGRPAKASQAGVTAVNGIYAAGIIDLAVGDYVEFVVYQNSGGALNIYGSANDMQFGLAYLGA